jgi:hypothetical protein
MNTQMQDVISCFERVYAEIDSSNQNYPSNKILQILAPHLEKIDFRCEKGKSGDEKISIPVLFGKMNSIDKCFNADAVSSDGKIVIEVEAGRATDNNQFLKDIFQACMMHEVEYLVIAVRQVYRSQNDFEKIYTFLETLYISGRLKLPLKGILLIGY